MRVNNIADAKQGLEGDQEDVVMGIDSDNHLTLLNSLTHLYSNPVLAALREYVANASDAHKVSGVTRPIELQYPFYHDTKSNLRVRDYGDGMTRDQLTRIYSQYGATTKGNTNVQVGGFGLGSKSGLAVSNHFFVNTVSNGVRVEAKVLRNDDNTSVIRILSEKPSKDDSGTEIILPLTSKQLLELNKNAADELVGYKSQDIKVNGKHLEFSIHNKEQFIPVTVGSNVIAYIERNPLRLAKMYQPENSAVRWNWTLPQAEPNYAIVMGGVYYRSMPTTGSRPTSQDFLRASKNLGIYLPNSPRVILNVPVGSVNLPPHRDSIIDTEKTWAALSQLMLNLDMGLAESAQRYLNDLELHEAVWVVASMPHLFAPKHKWVHRGRELDNDLSACLKSQPYFFQYRSPYPGRTTMLRDVTASDYITLYDRDYETIQGLDSDRKIRFIHLQLPDEFYEEIQTYRAKMKQPGKNPSPRAMRFITQYLASIAFRKHGVSNFFVMVTPEGVSMPDHFAPAFDEVTTMAETKALHKILFPREAKKVIQQKHCRIKHNSMTHSLIASDENIVFVGGKGNYLTDVKGSSSLYPVHLMKKLSNGQISDNLNTSWVQTSMLELVDSGTTVVGVGQTRAISAFMKAFPDANPMGKIVMDAYFNLNDTEKLAVKHAYSIIAEWNDYTDHLFTVLTRQQFTLDNESINLMFWEPKIAGIALHLYAFADSLTEGYEEWRNNFVLEVQNMREELASQLLLPIYSILSRVRYFDEKAVTFPTQFRRAVGSVVVSEISITEIVGFINKLTR